MRKNICALFLMLALSGSTFAGDMNSPPAPSPGVISTPRVPPTPGMRTAENWGEDPAADGILYNDYVDGIAAGALAALNSMLALL
ncbi:MAG: hypothetical protein ABW208_29545 [Pyrinomonadaceae bacterium]